MISLNDVLLAMSNIPVDDPIAEIWGRGLQSGYKIIEYTGTLPITINANGDALIDYRIYGADGGVGEPTENLIDASLSEQTIEIKPSTGYVICKYINIYARYLTYGIYDENDNLIWGDFLGSFTSQNIPIKADTKYFKISIPDQFLNVVSLVEGRSTSVVKHVPETYVPYGYKLPMTVQSANLFDKNAQDDNNGFISKTRLNSDGTTQNAYSFNVSEYIAVQPETPYYFSKISTNANFGPAECFYDSEKNFISSYTPRFEESFVATTPINAAYVRVSYAIGNSEQMITKGTEPPPKYIPHSKQIVPVYIGENQLDGVEGVSDYVDKASGKIVRMIGEYTFTGDESFNKYGNSDVFYTSKTIDPVGITTVNTITMRCDHPAFTAIENKDTRYWLNPEADDICCFLPGGRSQVFLRSTSNFTTAAECKAYLKAQYDNGTPVKISYWLKTPIEEAPPVSFPDIPTIKGETVIDYDGDPKPSQMYIKYKGKG